MAFSGNQITGLKAWGVMGIVQEFNAKEEVFVATELLFDLDGRARFQFAPDGEMRLQFELDARPRLGVDQKAPVKAS